MSPLLQRSDSRLKRRKKTIQAHRRKDRVAMIAGSRFAKAVREVGVNNVDAQLGIKASELERRAKMTHPHPIMGSHLRKVA